MNNKFDELTKAMARSVTRRGAFKAFGLGVAGMVLTYHGMMIRARATPNLKVNGPEVRSGYCVVAYLGGWKHNTPFYTGYCHDPGTCQMGPSPVCHGNVNQNQLVGDPCAPSARLDKGAPCSF